MRILFIALLLVANFAAAAPDIQVNGLFKGRALLTIDGQSRFLKDGQTSPEGVKLISSNTKQAVLEVDGKRHTLGLSKRVAAHYKPPVVAETKVHIPRGISGSYYTKGSINGRHVEMLVDTGATYVALNMNEAKRLGINYLKGTPSKANTANGVADTFNLTLDKVTVGRITLQNVKASVIVGAYPKTILLGNSFLNRVRMTVDRGVLVLTDK